MHETNRMNTRNVLIDGMEYCSGFRLTSGSHTGGQEFENEIYMWTITHKN